MQAQSTQHYFGHRYKAGPTVPPLAGTRKSVDPGGVHLQNVVA